MMRKENLVPVLFGICLSPAPALEEPPRLLKDINTIAELRSQLQPMLAAGGRLVFPYNETRLGHELWTTDGTAAGTFALDLAPGPAGSDPASLKTSGGICYFGAGDGVHGRELWRSDGTGDGTYMIKDLRPGAAGSDPVVLGDAAGWVFFSAEDGEGGRELWKTNGTDSGTLPVRDINTGPQGSHPGEGAVFNGNFYFPATTDTSGRELWRSNGTAEGTVQVRNIVAGSSSSFPRDLTLAGSLLYFAARSTAGGDELWKTDGTANGTVQVRDIYAGGSDGTPETLTPAGNNLLFMARDATNGRELWRSNGTLAGTALVKDIFPGRAWTPNSELAAAGHRLVLHTWDANRSGVPSRLWRSDGTAGGTAVLRERTEGSFTLASFSVPLAGTPMVFFGEFDYANRASLWKTDGTAAGTIKIIEFRQEDDLAIANFAGTMGNRIYFWRYSLSGPEIWVSDGTAAGTGLVASMPGPTGASNPFRVFPIGDRVLFTASDGRHGDEPWSSDGTAEGTFMLKDIVPGSFGSSASVLGVTGNKAFIQADYALWVTDGTAENFHQVLSPNMLSVFGVAGDHFFFRRGQEFWASDGTPEGTHRTGGPWEHLPYTATGAGAGNRYLFQANDPEFGPELWVCDGSPASARLLKNINPEGGGYPRNFFSSGPLAYFAADVYGGDGLLWRSDGTEQGTFGLGTITALSYVSAGNAVYFSGGGGNQFELWKTDGTPKGTVCVADPHPGFSAMPEKLTAFGSRVLYTAASPEAGRELWISDGTAAGTKLLYEFTPGPENTEVQAFAANAHRAFFTVRNQNEIVLWTTDGTPAGTRRFFRSHPEESIVFLPLVAGNKLYFISVSPLSGAELYVYDTDQKDTDRDGLPDDWEETRFGDLERDGTADDDGDGQSNVQEFVSGHHPARGSDFFRLGMTAVAPDAVYFEIDRVRPGRRYILERAREPEEGPWEIIVRHTFETAASNVPVVHPRGGGRWFYRMRVEME